MNSSHLTIRNLRGHDLARKSRERVSLLCLTCASLLVSACDRDDRGQTLDPVIIPETQDLPGVDTGAGSATAGSGGNATPSLPGVVSTASTTKVGVPATSSSTARSPRRSDFPEIGETTTSSKAPTPTVTGNKDRVASWSTEGNLSGSSTSLETGDLGETTDQSPTGDRRSGTASLRTDSSFDSTESRTEGSTRSTGDASDSGDGVTPVKPDPRVSHARGDGEIVTTVDATSYEEWLYLDLDKIVVDEAAGGTAAPVPGWDLSIQRYNFRLNGGVNGDAGVVALWVDGANAFEATLEVPDGEFGTDEPRNIEERHEGYYFREWYDYDLGTHVLTPKARIYVLKSSEGLAYKIQILDYYQRDSSPPKSGNPKFRWSLLSSNP